jgi:hypothetical protein
VKKKKQKRGKNKRSETQSAEGDEFEKVYIRPPAKEYNDDHVDLSVENDSSVIGRFFRRFF